MIHGQMPDSFKEKFGLRLTLQASGVEAESNILKIQINWDGKWTDEKVEINHHLVVGMV